jgi:hypothetical protein
MMDVGLSWFETAQARLLTMRVKILAPWPGGPFLNFTG